MPKFPGSRQPDCEILTIPGEKPDGAICACPDTKQALMVIGKAGAEWVHQNFRRRLTNPTECDMVWISDI